ncbi:MAG: 3-deoxy-manno-octulosonate cytidylyltransferase, partial [Cytophagales bacterium]|nr:3-deoxy-manno-octulosonate cytidylyltransferase [Cytophagales bacterium]
TRFPAKALANLQGEPMIVRTYRSVQSISYFQHVCVATDHPKIFDALEKRSIPVLMTRKDHKNGTERCAEALQLLQKDIAWDYLINVQGDVPFITAQHMNPILKLLKQKVNIATLFYPMKPNEDVNNPHLVKVVLGKDNKAIYFSRSPIPYRRNPVHLPYYQHVGVYAYAVQILPKLAGLPLDPIEEAESLEQLRWIANGYSIHACQTLPLKKEINTPDDLHE